MMYIRWFKEVWNFVIVVVGLRKCCCCSTNVAPWLFESWHGWLWLLWFMKKKMNCISSSLFCQIEAVREGNMKWKVFGKERRIIKRKKVAGQKKRGGSFVFEKRRKSRFNFDKVTFSTESYPITFLFFLICEQVDLCVLLHNMRHVKFLPFSLCYTLVYIQEIYGSSYYKWPIMPSLDILEIKMD